MKSKSFNLSLNQKSDLPAFEYERLQGEDYMGAVRKYFSVAALGENHFREGLKFLKQKMNELPNDPVLKAYFAGFVTIEARYKFLPLDKYRKALEGIELIEQIIKENPTHVEVRFIRMAVYYQMPAFFNKKAVALYDARRIWGQILSPDINPALKEYITDFLEKNKILPLIRG